MRRIKCRTGRSERAAMLVSLLLLVLVACTRQATAQSSFRIISWMVESGGADPRLIAEQMQGFDSVGLWGLVEVQASWRNRLQQAANRGTANRFGAILGTSGAADRMLVLYDRQQFDQLNAMELDHINVGGNVRAPLVVHLRHQDTNAEFLFVVNHLYRTQVARRHEQAALLNRWARTQSLPIVMVGDFNFDWTVVNGSANHDVGYDRLVTDHVFRWIQPMELIRTQCTAIPTGCRYDSILDFVFVAQTPVTWSFQSKVVVRPGDFPDDHRTSDHRPIETIIFVGTNSR